MHSEREWYAVVTFYADTPDDECEADSLADRFDTEIRNAVEALRAVSPGSVRVQELDSMREGWAVQSRLVRQAGV